MILKDCKSNHSNLAVAWVDYRKTHDMVPHSWTLECLDLVQMSDNIKGFIRRSMRSWRTELTAYREVLGKVNIRRVIFQSDSLSPLLFVICMIPLTKVLRKARAAYVVKDGNLRVNHLFSIDLKLFGKIEKEVDDLVCTVQLISKDIRMEFGIKKCGMVVMKRGQLSGAKGIVLANGQLIREVDKIGYKYLGILELDMSKRVR